MFIEVTSKGNPLLIRMSDILMVGTDKNGTFIFTESLDGITVKESYEEVKNLIADAELRYMSSSNA
ncbi:hypothetical protein [Pumilibacter muris]|uniref:hypothetical protein n=1 Tax=Pumilibacter muris TaxID=2941510 RepID=UPI0020410729|nr:hypothetical protein [Pumilibacter muris]